jgi:HEAT repeat protein
MTTLLWVLALSLGDDAEALDKFKADFKSRDAAARVAAVEELSKSQSPKVCAKLGSLLGVDTPEVRIAAAKALMGQQDDRKHAVAFLVGGAAANAKDPAVLAAIIASLGKLREEAGAAEVNKHIAAENVDLAKAAAQSAGEIRSGSSFDPLIKELKTCEDILKPRDPAAGGFGGRLAGGGVGRFAGNNGLSMKEMRDRAQMLKPEITKALKEMAKVSCQDAQDWENWWKEHRATYRPEKP